MRTQAVDVPLLIQLSRMAAYDWMTSLGPLRGYKRRAKRSCCRGQTRASIPADVIQALSRNPQLVRDLTRFKADRAVDKLVVCVGELRTML